LYTAIRDIIAFLSTKRFDIGKEMEKMDNHHKIAHSGFLPKRFKSPGKKQLPVKKSSSGSRRERSVWAISVTVISFILSLSILFLSSTVFDKITPYFSFIIVLLIIFIGVFFDIVGVEVTAADEKPFHAMASKKYKGAAQAIKLIRKADKVASICNDVVGDICGVVSGTAGAAIIFRFFSGHANYGLIEAVVGGLIAAITVGGKAFAKKFGMKDSHVILYKVGTLMAFFAPSNNGKKQEKG